MTDRHLHCVYFQYYDPDKYFKGDNPNKFEGCCLLKNKKIKNGFKPHCEDWVLRPHILISYYLKHEGYCEDWDCADDKALEYLDRIGFNTYPKIQKNDGDDIG